MPPRFPWNPLLFGHCRGNLRVFGQQAESIFPQRKPCTVLTECRREKKDYDRPGKTPKYFVTDTGLMASLLGVTDSAEKA